MRFKRKLTANAKADLTPMIDIVLQLVFFFLVSTTIKQTPAVNMNFPNVESSTVETLTELVVAVRSTNEIYINKSKMRLDEFSEQFPPLVDGLQNTDELAVTLEADKTAYYGTVMSVVDVMRQSGVYNYNLRTEIKRTDE